MSIASHLHSLAFATQQLECARHRSYASCPRRAAQCTPRQDQRQATQAPRPRPPSCPSMCLTTATRQTHHPHLQPRHNPSTIQSAASAAPYFILPDSSLLAALCCAALSTVPKPYAKSAPRPLRGAQPNSGRGLPAQRALRGAGRHAMQLVAVPTLTPHTHLPPPPPQHLSWVSLTRVRPQPQPPRQLRRLLPP